MSSRVIMENVNLKAMFVTRIMTVEITVTKWDVVCSLYCIIIYNLSVYYTASDVFHDYLMYDCLSECPIDIIDALVALRFCT